jgi:hypothetical protein
VLCVAHATGWSRSELLELDIEELMEWDRSWREVVKATAGR